MWRNLIVVLALSSIEILASPLYANLLWYSDGAPIDELVLEPLQVVTVQLYCDDPVAGGYDGYSATIGNDASTVADITQVTPLDLAGGLASVSPGEPDWWYLHSEWDTSEPRPYSVWGDHWDVTIVGLSAGDHSLSSSYFDFYGGQGTDTLTITVTPEPCSVLLLGLGGLALIRRKQ